jgi:serine/threonine protein kinase
VCGTVFACPCPPRPLPPAPCSRPAIACAVYSVYIVMQYANGGNLYDALTSSKHGRFPEKKTARYMKQLVE